MPTEEPRRRPVLPLSELVAGQEADTFAQLVRKEAARTRDNRPYWRVSFRDARREVSFPIWDDHLLADEVASWQLGQDYKLRATYRESPFGPQLEVRRVRLVTPDDTADGYRPEALRPRGALEPEDVFDELVALIQRAIADPPLAAMLRELLEIHREALLRLPASSRQHHAHRGGLLEHTLAVALNCEQLGQRYTALYPTALPPRTAELAIGGAIVHDLGRLLAWQEPDTAAAITPSEALLGHLVQGRDLFSEAAQRHGVDEDTRLRLEHVIMAHHGTPEMGSPIPPATAEALLVQHANALDVQLAMFVEALKVEPLDTPLTSDRNPLRRSLYRGETPDR